MSCSMMKLCSPLHNRRTWSLLLEFIIWYSLLYSPFGLFHIYLSPEIEFFRFIFSGWRLPLYDLFKNWCMTLKSKSLFLDLHYAEYRHRLHLKSPCPRPMVRCVFNHFHLLVGLALYSLFSFSKCSTRFKLTAIRHTLLFTPTHLQTNSNIYSYSE